MTTDISLIMTTDHGPDAEVVHAFAWRALPLTTEIAKRLGRGGTGQDLAHTTMRQLEAAVSDRWPSIPKPLVPVRWSGRTIR